MGSRGPPEWVYEGRTRKSFLEEMMSGESEKLILYLTSAHLLHGSLRGTCKQLTKVGGGRNSQLYQQM